VNEITAVLMMLMGVAIAGVWTRDIFVGDRINLTHGILGARDPDARALLWPHWLAEYAAAAALISVAVNAPHDARRPTSSNSFAAFKPLIRPFMRKRPSTKSIVSTTH